MHCAKNLGSKSKQQYNKNSNEITLLFRLPSNPSPERNDSHY